MFIGKKKSLLALGLLLVLVLVVAGCGGSSAKRIAGLAPEEVVKTFFDAAKANNYDEAALYVAFESRNDTKTVLKYVSGQSALDEIKNSNIIAVKKVAQQGDFAVVALTIQQQNSTKFSVKPVGLTRVDNEWYIVDFERIAQDAKYSVLQQLLSKI